VGRGNTDCELVYRVEGGSVGGDGFDHAQGDLDLEGVPLIAPSSTPSSQRFPPTLTPRRAPSVPPPNPSPPREKDLRMPLSSLMLTGSSSTRVRCKGVVEGRWSDSI
jgi:hypothetical protein